MHDANVCPECGAQVSRSFEFGYATASELGRPRGAKGEDTYEEFWVCPSHGKVNPTTKKVGDWWDEFEFPMTVTLRSEDGTWEELHTLEQEGGGVAIYDSKGNFITFCPPFVASNVAEVVKAVVDEWLDGSCGD